MMCLRWLLLLVPIYISKSFAQPDPCDTYDEYFKCNATATKIPSLGVSQPQQHINDNSLPGCETNLINTILYLIAKHSLAIDAEFLKLKGRNEAIRVIGNTGTGVSALTYFVAGSGSSLNAYKKSGEYHIMDCNGKIGDSLIVSTTTFPEVVVEPDTSIAFIDFPGFSDTRINCLEIPNAYSMINAAQRLEKAKIFIVVEYNAVTVDYKRSFIYTIKSVINVIPGIENLGQGIGIIVTKVDRPEDTDKEVVSYVIDFFNAALSDPGFSQNFNDPSDARKAKFIITTLLNKNRIGIFRVPDNCGPLNTIPLMVGNKLTLKYVTLINVNFAATQPSDFSSELSSDALLLVFQMRSNLTQEITSSLTTIALEVSSFLNYDCLTYSQCNETLAVIDKLFDDSEFTKGYASFDSWASATMTQIFNATTEVYFNLPSVVFSSDVSKLISTSAFYLTSLESIDNFRINLEAVHTPL